MAAGTYYDPSYTVAEMLEDLITDPDYGNEFDGNTHEANSVVAELPVTLIDLHLSSISDMPFGYDPHWDADGNWIS